MFISVNESLPEISVNYAVVQEGRCHTTGAGALGFLVAISKARQVSCRVLKSNRSSTFSSFVFLVPNLLRLWIWYSTMFIHILV